VDTSRKYRGVTGPALHKKKRKWKFKREGEGGGGRKEGGSVKKNAFRQRVGSAPKGEALKDLLH